MEGLRFQRALRTMILVCLIGLTTEFELEEKDWEELRSDLADLHRLNGLPNQMTRRNNHAEIGHDSIEMSLPGIRTKRFSKYRAYVDKNPMALLDGLRGCDSFITCVIQMDPDFKRFLMEIDGQKIQDVLLSASEISYTYSNKVLLMLDGEEYTYLQAEQEYSRDLRNSIMVREVCIHNYSCLATVNSGTVVKIFGTASEDGHILSGYSGSSLANLMLRSSLRAASVFSIDINTTSEFDYDFLRVFRSHDHKAVLETTGPEGCLTYQILDHTDTVVEYHAPKRPIDHTTQYDKQHIIILEDDPVVREAATFLYEKHPTVTSVYILENKRPKLIKGDPLPLSKESRLVLVGHGNRDSSGKMRLGGYNAEDVAIIIENTDRTGDYIKTTSVVGCEVGSDEDFKITLLNELRDKSINTEIHLKSSIVQVSHSGEKISVEITPDGLQRRHKDDSKKVVATLDRDGRVVTREQSMDRGERVFFSNEGNFLGGKDKNKFKITQPNPNHPQKYVEDYARNGNEYIDYLEALTWAFFSPDQHQFESPTKLQLVQSLVYDVPNEVLKPINNIEGSYYEITSGKDVLNVIYHQATVEENSPTYLMLHDWIYKVDHQTLYVYLAGKKVVNEIDKEMIEKEVQLQSKKEKYTDISPNINQETYPTYLENIFKGKAVETFNKQPWYGTYFLASVISESSRNFRTFPLVLMALDMAKSKRSDFKKEGIEFLFKNHPMLRKGSWVNPGLRGFQGSISHKESKKKLKIEELQNNLKNLIKCENCVVEKWLNKIQIENKRSNIKKKSKIISTNIYNLAQYYINGLNLDKVKFQNTYEDFLQNANPPKNNQATGFLCGENDGSVTSADLHSASELEHSLKLSSYSTRSSLLYADQIHSHLRTEFGDTMKELSAKEGSIRLEDGQFQFKLTSKNNPLEPIEFKMTLNPEGKLYEEKMWKNIDASHGQEIPEGTHPHQVSKHLERAGKVMGTVGFMLGMQGAVHAFERGDIEQGTVATLQTAHGVTEMTLAAIGKKVTQYSERGAMKAIVSIMKTPLVKGYLKVVPLIGIGFGLYSIVEDFKRKDALGNIDAAIDITIVSLDVLEFVPILVPVIAPINFALNTIRMGFDYIYLDIQKELHHLPPNATGLEKTGAVLIGFTNGFEDFIIDVGSFFFTIPYHEIEEGRRLVEHISDPQKYYSFLEDKKGRKTIDFTAGATSWNGGNITFCLSDMGQSKFCMKIFISEDVDIKCWIIETYGTKDIVLGIGESHGLTYTNIDLKMFMLFKVDSKSVVSGYEVLSDTRFGNYWGNNEANNFFAFQKSVENPAVEVMLSYYYKLYGKDGDDIFHLGPQRSYVEGCGGKDTFIIPDFGGNTIINNYDPLKSTDLLLLGVNYSQISVSKSGNDVIFTYLFDHNIRIINWFLGDEYRHIDIISGDGVLFDISKTVISSVQLIARSITKMFQTHGQTVNASEPLLLSVTNIVGSPFNDTLIGNKNNNQIEGGGGQDLMRGGEGKDIYLVHERNKSKLFIENQSNDNETDILIIEANLHDFKTQVIGNHLKLIPFSDQSSDVTLMNWFRSGADRHLLVVTKDLVTFSISENKAVCTQSDPLRSKCLKSQILDYRDSRVALNVDLQEDEAFQSVTEVQGSDFNDILKGNVQPNTFIPGRGRDFLQGRGGGDLYVITPGQGLKTINNHSPDLAVDILFLKEQYNLIKCKCSGQNINLSINGSAEVLLKGWFHSKYSQHLQIKSADGITFQLESNTSSCDRTLKLPQSVDFRRVAGHDVMMMNNREFASVVEMYGSPGYDVMVGNNQNNILDPFTGGGSMSGGNGEDSYIVKTGYGSRILINNFAKDERMDTLLFEMDFLSGGQLTVKSDEQDVLVSTCTKGHNMQVRLLNYNYDQQHQHLHFQSSDGVHFFIKSPVRDQTRGSQKPWIEAFKVTMKGQLGDCRLDLSSQSNLSLVHTVQGCPRQSNHITGNDQGNVLAGGLKDDALDGGAGHDTLIGGQGNDIMMGSTGDDTLYGEEGNDTMVGGSGSDTFVPGPGSDLVDGGPGRDTVLYQGDHQKGQGVYVNLLSGECRQADAEGDVLKDVENVIGTIYSDVLVSGYEPALLKGSDGNDILVSLVGGDYLIGGDGSDIYMMVNHHGSIVIDNCALDNSPDVLYLRPLSERSVQCSHLLGGVSLTFYGLDGATVDIELRNWVNHSHECGHLTLVLSEGEVSVDKLLQECQARLHLLKYIETFVLILLLAILHGFILVVPFIHRKRKWEQTGKHSDTDTEKDLREVDDQRSEEEQEEEEGEEKEKTE